MSTVLGSGTPRACALAEDGVHLAPILGAGTQPESAPSITPTEAEKRQSKPAVCDAGVCRPRRPTHHISAQFPLYHTYDISYVGERLFP